MKKCRLAVLVLTLSLPLSGVQASGASRSSGKNLVQAPSARSYALADAYVSRGNDIVSMNYNPASLRSLDAAQASLMYHRGLVEDSYGHFNIGSLFKKYGLGLSVAHYDGGSISGFDGVSRRNVKAQSDWLLGAGAARSIGPVDLGVLGKYFSSELAESHTADSFAADLGAALNVGSKLRLGTAIQNLGTSLEFGNRSEKLPRIARLGAAYTLPLRRTVMTFLAEAPYFMNERELRPGLGAEALFGPLAVRAGYKSDIELNEFSLGAGFNFGKAVLDYAFGFANDLDSTHRISLSYKFDKRPVDQMAKKVEPEPVMQVVAVSTPSTDVVAAQKEIEQIQEQIDSFTINPIHFEFDSDTLLAASYPTLDKVADVASRYKHLNLSVNGHTDSVGRRVYNLDLSRRRAAVVKNYLQSKCQCDISIAAAGYGEERPLVPNTTASNRYRNRRVEFLFDSTSRGQEDGSNEK